MDLMATSMRWSTFSTRGMKRERETDRRTDRQINEGERKRDRDKMKSGMICYRHKINSWYC